MGKTFVNDATVWRTAKRIWVNDSGTWRDIKKAWINDSGTWREVFTRAVEFSITTADNDPAFTLYGYVAATYGSISNASDGNGKTINGVYVQNTSETVLSITGFGADPGQSYVSEFKNTGNGTTFTGAGAAFYGYSAGTALWRWNGVMFPAGSPSFSLSTG